MRILELEVDLRYMESIHRTHLPNAQVSSSDGVVWVVRKVADEVEGEVELRLYRYEGRLVRIDLYSRTHELLDTLVPLLERLSVLDMEILPNPEFVGNSEHEVVWWFPHRR